LSFLSPCVLPLIPSYVSFITGLSLEDAGQRRWAALSHAVFFVLGFTAIFVLLGATATALGGLLNYHRVWLERIGGGLIVLFGLYLLGAFQWTALARERRIHLQNKPVGFLGSTLVGLAFGAGWSPCIGPILGAVLTYTSATATVGQGIGLLLVYSLGLGVPFLLAAVAVDRFLEWFKRYRRFVPWVNRIAGAMLVIVGLLLVTGYFSLLATWLQRITPEFIRSRI
jgi:cytochrome c-type biogenesis protein